MQFSNLLNNGPSDIQLCAIMRSLPKAMVLVLLLLCFGLTPGYGQDIIHVNNSANGANDGTSWADAYTSLNSALANATGSDVIVIAAGTYKPGSSRSDSFTITGAQDGLKIYGGWAGTETFSDIADVQAQLDSRDLVANRTKLSGDIDNNDLPFAPQSPSDDDPKTPTVTDHIQGGNSYTVWVLDGRSATKGGQGPITRSTIIDGMTITGGSADDDNFVELAGGGMRCNASGAECSPTLSNVIFKGNRAAEGGAIAFVFGTYQDDAESSPRIIKSVFSANSTGIYAGSDFDGVGGGAITFGGFTAESGSRAAIDISESVFADNVAFEHGGAIRIKEFANSGADVTMNITGTTFAGNKSDGGGNNAFGGRALRTGNGKTILTNCIIESAPPYIDGSVKLTALESEQGSFILSHTLIEHGQEDIDGSAEYLDENSNPVSFEQSTNISGDPKFLRAATPAGGDEALGTADDGLRLLEDSPALNAGLNDAVNSATDLTGAPRIQETTVDIGAYEGAIPIPVIFVDASAPDGGDGTSWATAFNDPQDAVAAAGPGNEIWIAEGVYRPDADDDTAPWLLIDGNKDGLQIYGGFAGNETRRSQRRPREHRTILSGDIDGDDVDPEGDGIIEHYTDKNGRNAKWIFRLESNQSAGSITRLTVIDGLMITAGGKSGISTSGYPTPSVNGGGLFCEVLDADVSCGPTLNNLVFVGNAALQGSALSFLYEVENDGGGHPSITNSVFTGNGTVNGTLEIRLKSTGRDVVAELSNNVFAGNHAKTRGGAFWVTSGSPSYNEVNSVRVVATNTSFIGNTTEKNGGAINALVNSNSSLEIVLTNSIFWDNQADVDGDGSGSGDHIFTESDDLTLSHSIMEGGASGVVGTTVSDFANSTNIDADPQFFAPDLPAGDDQILGTADDGFRLLPGSPALNAGTNNSVSMSTDLAGADRIQDGTVEMGAYEGAFMNPQQLTITGSEGWRMMTAPAENRSYASLLDTLWLQGMAGGDDTKGTANLYTWDEAAQQFQSVTDATTIPDAGQGFMVYVYDDQDADGSPEGFPKTLPVDQSRTGGTVAPALTYNDNGTSNDGFNLVGNPYGITIDWDDPGFTKTNLNAPFYVWSDSANSGTGAYLTWNGSTGTLPNGKIAPWQGFWVQANGSSPVLQFTEDVRSFGGTFYKENGSGEHKSAVPQITFELVGNELNSKAVVMFSSQAKAGKDRLDALKLQSLNEDYISLYTTSTERHTLDINALPTEFESPLEVNLDFKGSNIGGEYTLSWNPKALPESWAEGSVKLTDLHTDRTLNLDKAGEYSFEVEGEKEKIKTKSLNQASTPDPPQHGSIPTILKAKAANPRFVLTVSPNETESSLADIPKQVELNQNYPNPFNPETVIRYGVPERASVQLNVYDVLGRKVRTLVNEQKSSGRYKASFNASELASGLYFYRLKVGTKVLTKKMMLIK